MPPVKSSHARATGRPSKEKKKWNRTRTSKIDGGAHPHPEKNVIDSELYEKLGRALVEFDAEQRGIASDDEDDEVDLPVRQPTPPPVAATSGIEQYEANKGKRRGLPVSLPKPKQKQTPSGLLKLYTEGKKEELLSELTSIFKNRDVLSEGVEGLPSHLVDIMVDIFDKHEAEIKKLVAEKEQLEAEKKEYETLAGETIKAVAESDKMYEEELERDAGYIKALADAKSAHAKELAVAKEEARREKARADDAEKQIQQLVKDFTSIHKGEISDDEKKDVYLRLRNVYSWYTGEVERLQKEVDTLQDLYNRLTAKLDEYEKAPPPPVDKDEGSDEDLDIPAPEEVAEPLNLFTTPERASEDEEIESAEESADEEESASGEESDDASEESEIPSDYGMPSEEEEEDVFGAAGAAEDDNRPPEPTPEPAESPFEPPPENEAGDDEPPEPEFDPELPSASPFGEPAITVISEPPSDKEGVNRDYRRRFNEFVHAADGYKQALKKAKLTELRQLLLGNKDTNTQKFATLESIERSVESHRLLAQQAYTSLAMVIEQQPDMGPVDNKFIAELLDEVSRRSYESSLEDFVEAGHTTESMLQSASRRLEDRAYKLEMMMKRAQSYADDGYYESAQKVLNEFQSTMGAMMERANELTTIFTGTARVEARLSPKVREYAHAIRAVGERLSGMAADFDGFKRDIDQVVYQEQLQRMLKIEETKVKREQEEMLGFLERYRGGLYVANMMSNFKAETDFLEENLRRARGTGQVSFYEEHKKLADAYRRQHMIVQEQYNDAKERIKAEAARAREEEDRLSKHAADMIAMATGDDPRRTPSSSGYTQRFGLRPQSRAASSTPQATNSRAVDVTN